MTISSSEKKTLLAGAAKVNITPSLGSFSAVDFKTHIARFIHDELFAKVLILKNENICMAIVVVDICIMSTEFMDNIKDKIKNETGIEPENVLLSSTHTHGSGAVIGLLGSSPDLAYMKILPPLIATAVKEAKENLRPAKISSGYTNVADHVRCRRYFMKPGYITRNPITGNADMVKTNPIGAEHLIEAPASPTDPGLSFLAIKGVDDRWISVLGNYSLHYVGDWHVDSITADYFGEFSNQIKQLLHAGDDFVGMMSNGTSGDVNIWDFMQLGNYPTGDLEKTKLIGKDLATKVFEEIKHAVWEHDPKLGVAYNEIPVGIRKPSINELEDAKKIIAESDYDNITIDDSGMIKIYAREQLLLNEYPETSVSKVQALKIGNLTIGALGGEFFAETGLWLKENITECNYFSIALANSYDGYIVPAHEIERGGYETWRARSSCLETGAENKIKNELLDLVKKVSE